jgi:hypothetical protein
LRIDDAAKAAKADGQVALAITDLSNLFGAVKFYKACRGKGVKPILGVDVWMEPLAGPATSSPAGCCCWCRTAGLPQPVRTAGARLDATRSARRPGSSGTGWPSWATG